MKPLPRCINLDWLEVAALEPIDEPHDADFFRACGCVVIEREYGTRVWAQMFTIEGEDHLPFMEVRRCPKSEIIEPNIVHLRLVNRECYFPHAASIMAGFLEEYRYDFHHICRVDVCSDFEKFDYGDDPKAFMRRFMEGKYSKINQANIHAHGSDDWAGRVWNSLSWGAPSSDVGTKFYNKSMELREKADKPYIRQAWCAAHLIDDADSGVKYTKNDDGTITTTKPDVWRVEFSIKSSTRNWFVIENCKGAKKTIESKKHTLAMYQTKEDLLTMFFSLADHYFHFKYFQPSVRKDRCVDKMLFRTKEKQVHYKLENVATTTTPEKSAQRLINMLTKYRDEHVTPDIYKACNTIIAKLLEEVHTISMPIPWDMTEVKALQLLIQRRMQANTPHAERLEDIIQLLKATESDPLF